MKRSRRRSRYCFGNCLRFGCSSGNRITAFIRVEKVICCENHFPLRCNFNRSSQQSCWRFKIARSCSCFPVQGSSLCGECVKSAVECHQQLLSTRVIPRLNGHPNDCCLLWKRLGPLFGASRDNKALDEIPSGDENVGIVVRSNSDENTVFGHLCRVIFTPMCSTG